MEYPHVRLEVWPKIDRSLAWTITLVNADGEKLISGHRPERGPVSGITLPGKTTTVADARRELDRLEATYWDDPDLHN